MNATQAAALQVGQRIQWSDHHVDEVVLNDGASITVKRGPGQVEVKTPPALPPRRPQAVEMQFAYAALADAGIVFANPSLTEDAPPDGEIYGRDGLNGKWVISGRGGIRPPAQQIDYRIGLDDTVPGIVDLQPATPLPGEIGGINEPVPSDIVVYARKYDLAGVATWEPISVAGIIISDTPPMVPPPVHGQLWWESDTGATFIWYNDGTSAQYVQIAPGDDSGRNDLPIFYGIGLTRTGLTVDLDPATNLALGGITEPTPDGLAYSRQWDNVTDPVNPRWVWVPALTAGLQITSIIPDKAIYGPGEPLLTVHAYGAEFTPTTVAVVDGVNTATTIISTTELTFVMNPAVPISEQFHIITVRDPAVPEDGLGAEQFDFIKASTDVDYGRGLSLDTLPTPPIVNLDPAGPTNMGGVIVPIRDGRTTGLVIDMGNEALGDPATGHLTAPPATAMLLGTVKVPERTQGQGLTLGDDGMLTLRIATDQHLGGILEPAETGRAFARQVDDTTRLGEWVEVQGGMEEPPMHPVTHWARSSGGVRGWVPIPDQVEGMEEPPMEPAQTWGRSSGGVRGWLPIPDTVVEAGRGLSRTDDPTTLHLDVATAIDLGGVFVPGNQGLELSQVGELQLARARPDMIGGLLEPPYDDTAPTRTFTRRWGEWVEAEPGGMEEPPMDPVQTWGRSSGGARGWLPIPEQAGMQEPPMDPVALWARSSGGARGWLEIPPGIEDVPPAPKDEMWVRSLGVWKQLPPIPRPTRPAGKIEAEIGVVFVPDRLGLAVGPDGQLALQPAEPDQIGGLREVPGAGPWLRKTGAWEQYTPADAVTYGIGINLDGDVVNLQPATGGDQTGAPEIGGVYGTTRSERNGIAIDSYGHISAPLATDSLAGTLLEPPPDDKGYVRRRDLNGVSQWVPPALPPDATKIWGIGIDEDTPGTVDLKPANFNGEIGGVLVVGRSPLSGLEYDPATGSLWAPLATNTLAGSIVEPPTDGLRYARSNDVMSGPVWVPTTSGGVVIGDAPPATPVPGGLWWDSDSGNTYLWYTDVDSSQWVQVASSSTGIEEAPVNNTPHVRQNAMWLPTALTTTAGDVKSGFQTVDHGGWIKLDGRAVSTLTVTQQDQAALLGFTANLPNAALCGLRQDSAAVPGVVGGSAKITVANLPAHNMTSGGHDAGAVTTSGYDPGAVTTSNALGFSDLVGVGPQTGKIAAGGTGQYYIRADSYSTRDYNHSHTVDLPNHTHTVDMPNHTHTVALGGSGTDYYAKAMVVNFFVFLGA